MPERKVVGLRDENVNALAAKVISEGPRGPLAGEVTRDWRGFLRSHLELNVRQTENLANIPPTEVEKIQDALGRAIRTGGRVNLRMAQHGASGELLIQSDDGSSITIGGHLKCTFDADCGGWSCSVGPGL